MAELIGTGRCPVCGNDRARFTLSRNRLAVCTCNACNFQGFARSDRSDELLRQRITAAANHQQDAAPDDKPAAVPVEPPAVPEPTNEPAPRRRMGWGILAGMET